MSTTFYGTFGIGKVTKMSAQTPNLPQNFANNDNLAQKTRELLHLVPQHDGRAHCMTVLLRLAEVAWVRIPRPTTKFLCIWNRINVHAR